MPLFFGVIGIVLIICAINNTLGNGQDGLVDLVKKDFTGQNNFLTWILAICIAGAFGYIPKMKPVSYAFFVLIFVSIILANQKQSGQGGVFANLFSAIQNANNGNTPSSPQVASSGGSGGGSSTASDVKTAMNYAKIAAMFLA